MARVLASVSLPIERNVGPLKTFHGAPNGKIGKKVSVNYTDASIWRNKGGLGVAKLDSADRFTNYSKFGAFVTENKDINRVELGAIFMSIVMAEDDADLVIYSDSLNSITKLVGVSKKNRCDKLAKFTLEIARERAGKVFISKVKAHSGNVGNELVDRIARSGTGYKELVLPDEFSSVDEWKKFQGIKSHHIVCMLK